MCQAPNSDLKKELLSILADYEYKQPIGTSFVDYLISRGVTINHKKCNRKNKNNNK